MIWDTKFTKMTGVEYPIIMAAFARWGSVDFAAAFSNSGGLGIITSMNISLNWDMELHTNSLSTRLTARPLST